MERDPALSKLVRVLGHERTTSLAVEAMQSLGLASIETPNDRLRLGQFLIRKGGLLETIGRSIRVQAMLHGATDE